MTRRPRVLFVTSTPPADEMGGSMLFHRQFVQRNDYELMVVTDRTAFESDRFPVTHYEHPPLLKRLQNTRLSLFAHDYVHVLSSRRIPSHLIEAARSFRPDLVMTGCETWIADLAIRLARKLNVPLAGHFMDWPTYGMLGHKIVKQYCSSRFKKRYQACDLAFGICPEMLEALGPHSNSHVFYPPGQERKTLSPTVAPPANEHAITNPDRAADASDDSKSKAEPSSSAKPFRVLFAGNLGEWYGTMLLSLAKAIDGVPQLSLRIAGKNAEWSDADTRYLQEQGTLAGFLKGDQYQRELEQADALLVIMGFSEESKPIESTSFKSKIADYLVSGKPVVVWGPEYCTAARAGRREGFAAVVDQPDPQLLVDKLDALSRDDQAQAELVQNGQRFFDENLAPEVVFRSALDAIETLVQPSPGGSNK